MSAVAFCVSSLKWWQDPSESEKALIGIQIAPMHFLGTFCCSHLRMKLQSVELGPCFIRFCGSNE